MRDGTDAQCTEQVSSKIFSKVRNLASQGFKIALRIGLPAQVRYTTPLSDVVEYIRRKESQAVISSGHFEGGIVGN